MKNKLHFGVGRLRACILLKPTCFFFLFTIFICTPIRAQEVTLKYNNVRLGRVFEDITRQTNLTFAYSREVVNIDRQVSIDAGGEDLGSVLGRLFAGTGIRYEIKDGKIFLSPGQGSGSIRINANITGTVTDDIGNPMAGVAVVVKGSNVGAISDANGNYRIRVDASDPVLQFTFIGYETAEIKLTQSHTVVNVTMRDQATSIDGVVVTALGITRAEKSLGYAITKVENEALNTTVSNNWLNALSGKVAGLNFDNASAGPGGSMRVTLRGEGSLSHDKNAALFVIDGVPVSSDMTASNGGSVAFNTDAPVDYGNGASDFNPEDIESISVLKGPTATALYGARAANGAIIITTKSGRQAKGLGVSVNSSVTIERAGFWPDFQDEYGAGNGNVSNIQQQYYYNYWSVPGTASEDGVERTGRVWSRVAFGPKFEGQMFYQYESRNWETNTYKLLPWEYNDKWYTGLFRTGVTWTNSVSIENSDGKGNTLRASVRDLRNEWIVPNTGYTSQNFSLSLTQQMHKAIRLKAYITYYRRDSGNLPMSGYNNASPLYTLIWSPNVVGLDSYKREWQEGRIQQMWREGTQSQLINSDGGDNPYLQLYEQLNTLDRDRVYGNLSLQFKLMENLTLDLRTGMDFNYEFRTQQKPYYSYNYRRGYYKEQSSRRFEMNNDFLLNYNKDFNDISFRAAFGGNNMVHQYQRVTLSAPDGLAEPGVYKLSNSVSQVLADPYRSNKSVNSFYGFVNLSWRDMVFLDLTNRFDWTSTLSRKNNNNSYFYPSVSLSVLVDQLIDLRSKVEWVDMIKVRGSWANVGNDTDPYQLYHRYSTSNFPSSYYLPNSVQNKDIKPENVESWEAGVEATFFKNRFSLDATYYFASTTNQIIPVPIDQITAATSRLINAGKVTNKGVELALRVQPIRTRDWSWTINANWTKNWNKLVELAKGVDVWQMNSSVTINGNVFIYAYPGTELGRIYGRGYKRAPDGAYYLDGDGNKIDCAGQVIVDSNGYPTLTATDELLDLGSIYPDWKAGMTHSVSFKNLKMSMTFTGQVGGKMFSTTNMALSYTGKLTNSLEGRYAGLIHEGVNQLADGTYRKNNTITTNIVAYYDTYVWPRENVENNTFDTSFLKLKEIRLDYSLPRKVCDKIKFIQGASVGFFATNLFCWTNYPFYDPEAGTTVGSSIIRGIEAGAYPLTRTYGLNVKLNF